MQTSGAGVGNLSPKHPSALTAGGVQVQFHDCKGCVRVCTERRAKRRRRSLDYLCYSIGRRPPGFGEVQDSRTLRVESSEDPPRGHVLLGSASYMSSGVNDLTARAPLMER